jgi:hypothetical protein
MTTFAACIQEGQTQKRFTVDPSFWRKKATRGTCPGFTSDGRFLRLLSAHLRRTRTRKSQVIQVPRMRKPTEGPKRNFFWKGKKRADDFSITGPWQNLSQ